MNRTATITLVAVAAAFAMTPAHASEAVADGFTRLFDHQPHHGPTATTVRAERDVMAAAVASSLQRGSAKVSARTSSDDPVIASFERLFEHRPHHGPTATALQAESDPLVAAVVLPLLRDQAGEQRLAAVTRRRVN